MVAGSRIIPCEISADIINIHAGAGRVSPEAQIQSKLKMSEQPEKFTCEKCGKSKWDCWCEPAPTDAERAANWKEFQELSLMERFKLMFGRR